VRYYPVALAKDPQFGEILDQSSELGSDFVLKPVKGCEKDSCLIRLP
jgi:hypothetical protein